jgi:redox-sensitive bicupin YhaK (pirin superfamily)
MPAVTADPFTLPRTAAPAAEARPRPVAKVIAAQRAVEGDGFVVRRPFPGVLSMHDADPFLLLDHLGAVELAPGEAKGTPWHPHRGFETVTYMIDGQMHHEDSTGGGGTITDGATQWMTAGDGILHVERPSELLVTQGGVLHGVQLWVNLPAADKRTAPRYQSIEAGEVALAASPDGGALLRVIAGEVAGIRGPGSTHTPIAYVHATLAPGARLELPWDPASNALAYVLAGDGTAGAEQVPLTEAHLAVFDASGDTLVLQAADRQPVAAAGGWEVLVLGGRPIREPIVHYGPFVMNTKAEIIETIEDFNAGRLGKTFG